MTTTIPVTKRASRSASSLCPPAPSLFESPIARLYVLTAMRGGLDKALKAAADVKVWS